MSHQKVLSAGTDGQIVTTVLPSRRESQALWPSRPLSGQCPGTEPEQRRTRARPQGLLPGKLPAAWGLCSCERFWGVDWLFHSVCSWKVSSRSPVPSESRKPESELGPTAGSKRPCRGQPSSETCGGGHRRWHGWAERPGTRSGSAVGRRVAGFPECAGEGASPRRGVCFSRPRSAPGQSFQPSRKHLPLSVSETAPQCGSEPPGARWDGCHLTFRCEMAHDGAVTHGGGAREEDRPPRLSQRGGERGCSSPAPR